MALRKCITAAMLLFTFAGCLSAREIPEGGLIPKCTFSPNHRYGVLVGDRDFVSTTSEPGDPRNQVIELATGRVVVVMNAEGDSRRSYGGRVPGSSSFWNTFAQPRWSADSSLLLWKVNGKWSPQAIVLVWLEKNVPPHQLDVLHIAQEAILMRTQKAQPQKYRATKKEYYFAVNVYTDGEHGKSVSLPLAVHADLISAPDLALPNPLASQLDGIIREDGAFVVTRFKLALRHNENF